MSTSLRALAVALLAVVSAEETADQARSTLLLYKKLSQADGHSVNTPFNVTLTVYNRGAGTAYSLMVIDDNWKEDKFQIVAGSNNFTLDYLTSGDSYDHKFVVKPLKKALHRVRPAKMFFVDGADGESTTTHLSNSLPDVRVAENADAMEGAAIMIGRILSLNMIKSKRGWMVLAAVVLVIICVQVYFIGSKVLQRRRHRRALEDVKKL